MKNSFLSEFKEREYFNQCTNSEELDNLMHSKKINAYIGFDCTAQSLHVGSLLQIMCLRMLQKYGHRPIVILEIPPMFNIQIGRSIFFSLTINW